MKIIVEKKKKKIVIVKNNIAIRIVGKVSRYIVPPLLVSECEGRDNITYSPSEMETTLGTDTDGPCVARKPRVLSEGL